MYAPGAVFADLAAAVADGADCIDGVGQLCGDREHVFGAKASTTTMWRLVDSVSTPPTCPRSARRRGRWPGCRGRPTGGSAALRRLRCHAGHRPFRQQGPGGTDVEEVLRPSPAAGVPGPPEIAGGEALAGLLRKGNAGSNTAADHITVLDQALASLPAGWRPDPEAHGSPAVVVRSDTAGATHRFAQACRDRGVGFSFGFPVDARVWDAVDTLNLAAGWYPAIDAGGEPVTGVGGRSHRTGQPVDLAFRDPTCPAQRKAAPRCTAALHRHRRHASDRVHHRHRPRSARATGRSGTAPPPARPRRGPHPPSQSRRPTNLPCHSFDANAAWLEVILAAADLVAWAQLIGFTDTPELARCGSTPSATGSCMWRPASPRRPPTTATHRHHLALGRRHRHRLATHPRRIPMTTRHPVPTTRKTNRPWESPPTPATRADQTHPYPKPLSLSTFHRSAPRNPPARKIEANPSAPTPESRPGNSRRDQMVKSGRARSLASDS